MFINAAGVATVEIMRAHENPAPSPQQPKQEPDLAAKINDIAKAMNSMTIKNSPPRDPEQEKSLDQANKDVKYKDLATPDLPSGSTVFITYVNNPSEFVVSRTSSRVHLSNF